MFLNNMNVRVQKIVVWAFKRSRIVPVRSFGQENWYVMEFINSLSVTADRSENKFENFLRAAICGISEIFFNIISWEIIDRSSFVASRNSESMGSMAKWRHELNLCTSWMHTFNSRNGAIHHFWYNISIILRTGRGRTMKITFSNLSEVWVLVQCDQDSSRKWFRKLWSSSSSLLSWAAFASGV